MKELEFEACRKEVDGGLFEEGEFLHADAIAYIERDEVEKV